MAQILNRKFHESCHKGSLILFGFHIWRTTRSDVAFKAASLQELLRVMKLPRGAKDALLKQVEVASGEDHEIMN